MFVWGFTSHSRIVGEGLKFWPLPLSSEGSLKCHTFCDTGRPNTPRNHNTRYGCRAHNKGAVTTWFDDLENENENAKDTETHDEIYQKPEQSKFVEIEGRRIVNITFFVEQLERGCYAYRGLNFFLRG